VKLKPIQTRMIPVETRINPPKSESVIEKIESKYVIKNYYEFVTRQRRRPEFLSPVLRISSYVL